MSIFTALRYRSFAFLFVGQTVSRLGDYLYNVALAWWVLQATGSASAMGTVLLLTALPRVFFLLIGGVVVDRVPRALVLLVTDTSRAVIVVIVTLLALTGILEIWMIFIASFFFGMFSAFFEPAFVAIVPQLVPVEGRTSANALMSLTRRLSGIVGPALGATLVAIGGTSLAFGLDALSFAFAALMVLPIWRSLALNAPPPKRPHILADLREGWRYVRDTPWLWISVLIFSIVNPLQYGPYSTVLPVLVEKNLNATVEAYGFIFAATSLGATLTSLWLARFKRLRHRGPAFYGAVFVQGLLVAAMGAFLTVPAEIGIAFFFGVASGVGNMNWSNILQDHVPGNMLGRVASLDSLISIALVPVGFGLAGLAADAVGAPMVLLGGGLLAAAIVATGFFSRAIRELD